MSDKPYTKKQLTEVENMAEKQGFEGMAVRFANSDLETSDTGFTHHKLDANARQPFGHRHENAEEVYVVIDGAGRVKIDDEVIELVRLDAIRLEPGVTRCFEGGGDGMEMLAFGPRHEGDGDVFPGWWKDD